MADTKISGLTPLTTAEQNDVVPIVDVSPTPTTKRITVANLRGGYVLMAGFSNHNPADATTYYFGSLLTLVPAGAQVRRIHFPRSGTITAVSMFWRNASVGTSINSTVSLRLNDTTDTIISSAVNNANATQSILADGFSISVTPSDFIEFKWVTPTWATDPTGVYAAAWIYVS